jgi:pimeloyl-ACP methyl ester carboxylesterase
MSKSQMMDIQGAQLEVLHIPLASATGNLPYLPAQQPRPVAIFLHEGLGSVALWRDWPTQVCQALGCEGWVYSRRGYGQSAGIADVRGAGRLKAHYMHREALEVLPELLQALKVKQPLLIGHSDGASIALIHASHFEVAGCVAMAPHVMVEDISLKAIAQARDQFEKLKPRLAPFHRDVECAFWQWNDVWLSEAFRNFDIRPLLNKIHAPLMAIQGADDPYGTMAQIDDIASRVLQTQLVKLENCGHSPHKDQADAVLQALKNFSSSLGKIHRH